MVDERDDGKEVKEEAPPKKKLPIRIIVIVLVAVLLIGGGLAGYFLLLSPKGKQGEGEGGKKAETHGQASEKGEKKEGPMRALEPFVVNLTDIEGSRYLKVVMQLELSSEEMAPEVDKKIPQIRDEIIMLLSSKSFEDLSTPPGKRAVKRGVVENVNKCLTTGKVTNVYFTEFVVQ